MLSILLFAVSCASAFRSFPLRKAFFDSIKYHEIIKVDVDQTDPALLVVKLNAFSRELDIELERNDMLIEANMNIIGLPKGYKKKTESCHYIVRTVRQNKDSHGAFSLCDHHGLRGTLRVGHEVFHIKPSAHFLDESVEHHKISDDYIIYREQDTDSSSRPAEFKAVEISSDESIKTVGRTDLTTMTMEDMSSRRNLLINRGSSTLRLLIVVDPITVKNCQDSSNWYSVCSALVTGMVNKATATYKNNGGQFGGWGSNIGTITLQTVSVIYMTSYSMSWQKYATLEPKSSRGIYKFVNNQYKYTTQSDFQSSYCTTYEKRCGSTSAWGTQSTWSSKCTSTWQQNCEINSENHLHSFREWFKNLASTDGLKKSTDAAMMIHSLNYEGNVKGIAYIGGVCKNYGLRTGTMELYDEDQDYKTLIHELGHLIGANHVQCGDLACPLGLNNKVCANTDGVMGYGWNTPSYFSRYCSLPRIQTYWAANNGYNVQCLGTYAWSSNTGGATAPGLSAHSEGDEEEEEESEDVLEIIKDCTAETIELPEIKMCVQIDGLSDDVDAKYGTSECDEQGYPKYTDSDGDYTFYRTSDGVWTVAQSQSGAIIAQCGASPGDPTGCSGNMEVDGEIDSAVTIGTCVSDANALNIDDNTDCLNGNQHKPNLCIHSKASLWSGYADFALDGTCYDSKPVYFHKTTAMVPKVDDNATEYEVEEEITYFLYFDADYQEIYTDNTTTTKRWIINVGQEEGVAAMYCEQEEILDCIKTKWNLPMFTGLDGDRNKTDHHMIVHGDRCSVIQAMSGNAMDGEHEPNAVLLAVLICGIILVIGIVIGVGAFIIYKRRKEQKKQFNEVADDEEENEMTTVNGV